MAVEAQTALAVGDLKPADVGMVATLLRTDIGIILVAYLALVETDELTAVAVTVVLVRATTVILDGVILFGHLQLHAIAEHPCLLSISLRLHLLANDDLAVLLQGVGHGQHGHRHVNVCHNGIAVYGTADNLHRRVFPLFPALLHPCTIVIVGRSTPELRCDALTVDEHGLAVNVQIVNQSGTLTDSHRRAASRQLIVALGLLHLGTADSLRRSQFRPLIGLDDELLACQHLSLVNVVGSHTAAQFEVDADFLVGMMAQYTCQHLFDFVGSNSLALLRTDATEINLTAMTLHLPRQFHVVE